MLALFQRVIDQPSLAPKRWLITVHSCKEESLGPSVFLSRSELLIERPPFPTIAIVIKETLDTS